MTEKGWLSCEVPGEMIVYLREIGTNPRIVCHLKGRVLLRKLQLFLCACCRLQWDDLADERSRRAVEVAERYADGLAKKWELQQARRGAVEATRGGWWSAAPVHHLAAEALNVSGGRAWSAASGAASNAPLPLLRCVFGNPFRPVCLDGNWLTPDVVSLADAAYEERIARRTIDPFRLSLAADALEEAGCTDAAIIGHLRCPGRHVRGCWAIDRLTGRE